MEFQVTHNTHKINKTTEELKEDFEEIDVVMANCAVKA